VQDLNDLQYFAQVVRHGGFSAASRATGEPKSKLSKRVAQLKRDLGVRLIERSTRSIQVTEIGRDVFAQCEVIAGGLEATETIVVRSRDDARRGPPDPGEAKGTRARRAVGSPHSDPEGHAREDPTGAGAPALAAVEALRTGPFYSGQKAPGRPLALKSEPGPPVTLRRRRMAPESEVRN
jgi:hypothetical protein